MAFEPLACPASIPMRRLTVDQQATGTHFSAIEGTNNKLSPAFTNDGLDPLPIWLVDDDNPNTILQFAPEGGATPIDVGDANPSYVAQGTAGIYYMAGFSYISGTDKIHVVYTVDNVETQFDEDNAGFNFISDGAIGGYPATVTDGGATALMVLFNDSDSGSLYYLAQILTAGNTINFFCGIDTGELPGAFDGSNQVLFRDEPNSTWWMPTILPGGTGAALVQIEQSPLVIGGPFSNTLGWSLTFAEDELNAGGQWTMVGNSNSEIIYYYDNQDGNGYIVIVQFNGASYYAYRIEGDFIPTADEVMHIAITPDS